MKDFICLIDPRKSTAGFFVVGHPTTDKVYVVLWTGALQRSAPSVCKVSFSYFPEPPVVGTAGLHTLLTLQLIETLLSLFVSQCARNTFFFTGNSNPNRGGPFSLETITRRKAYSARASDMTGDLQSNQIKFSRNIPSPTPKMNK